MCARVKTFQAETRPHKKDDSEEDSQEEALARSVGLLPAGWSFHAEGVSVLAASG